MELRSGIQPGNSPERGGCRGGYSGQRAAQIELGDKRESVAVGDEPVAQSCLMLELRLDRTGS